MYLVASTQFKMTYRYWKFCIGFPFLGHHVCTHHWMPSCEAAVSQSSWLVELK